MSDDTEMGRPPRHAGEPRSSAGGMVGDLLRRGTGEHERVRGDRRCRGCEKPLHVDFSGPADSMGVSIARARLASPLCDDCDEREERERAAVEAQAELVERLRKRVAQSGVPMPWRSRTLGELAAKPGQEGALAVAARWARGETVGMLMHGETGVGKTLIAAAATVSRCAMGPARWLGMAALLTDLRMPFDSPEYARAVRQLDPGIAGVALTLDDVDKMKPSEHSLQPLYVAVNGWIELGLPLCVTLNRDLGAFADWGGESFGAVLASRLAGYCEVVHVQGEDWRLT